MQQIWTRPRPGPPQEPHQYHSTPARPVTAPIRAHGSSLPVRKAHCTRKKGVAEGEEAWRREKGVADDRVRG